jgi:molybdopterin/thiamine biosynthesis adenylyltransferase
MKNKYNKPIIKSIYPVYQLNDHVFRIGAQKNITSEFTDPQGKLFELVSILDGRDLSAIVAHMQDKFPDLTVDDVYYGLDLLNGQNFIEEKEENLKHTIDERYLPNVHYFSRFMSYGKSPYDIQKKLNDSTVLLLGLGGGGSNILTLLSGLGPKKVKIVDYDIVERSNLGRQLLYREADIGRLKVDVAAESIKAMNSLIAVEAYNKKIETVDDVLAYIDGVDIIISVIDEPQFLVYRTVNKAAVAAGVPCVFGASQVSRGRVFSVIPQVTGCFDCLNIHYTKHDERFVDQFIGFNKIDFNPPTVAYAPAIYNLTGAIVDEAVRILTGYTRPMSSSTQYEINYEDGASFTHPAWKRYERECPTCGSGNDEDWAVFSYYRE